MGVSMGIATLSNFKSLVIKPLDLIGKWVAFSHIPLHDGVKNVLHNIKITKDLLTSLSLFENPRGLFYPPAGTNLTIHCIKSTRKVWRLVDYLWRHHLFPSRPPELFKWAGTAADCCDSISTIMTTQVLGPHQTQEEKFFVSAKVIGAVSALAESFLKSPYIPTQSYRLLKVSLSTVTVITGIIETYAPKPKKLN
jgi:hypothetical protein